MDDQVRSDHHYLPRLYLKLWASDDQRVWTYRTLVSHATVPAWGRKAISGVAHQEHLYTQLLTGLESDKVERWFDREFENPARDALQRATSDHRMAPGDWRRLIRFAMAQDVRTPARFLSDLQRWHKELPETIEETMEASIRALEAAQAAGTLDQLEKSGKRSDNPFPVRVTTGIDPEQESGWIGAEVTVGRALWLAKINHLLTSTIEKIPMRGWTILAPRRGLSWFTSDNPVIRLNYYRPGRYDFRGGWGNPGSEILLPLGPRHLLYTHVGRSVPRRGTEMPHDFTVRVRQLIAQHAHRMILAEEPDERVPVLRPRRVDAALFEEEAVHWKRWHEDQCKVEAEISSEGSPEEPRSKLGLTLA